MTCVQRRQCGKTTVENLSREGAVPFHFGSSPLYLLTTQTPYWNTVNQLSMASSESMPGRNEQTPVSGCQQEAYGKEAAESRAEDQAGGAAPLLQLKK